MYEKEQFLIILFFVTCLYVDPKIA